MGLFHDFSLKVARGSRVPPQSLKKTPKWTPKGDQMEPRGVKVQHQGYKKCRKSTTWSPRVPKRSPGCYNGAPRSPQMQNTHKKLTQLAKKTYQKVPQVAKQKRKTIYPQTTNQPTKETKRDTKKQTIEQKHTRTRASNCKHKHKFPRPGARRRRRRSRRGFSERTLQAVGRATRAERAQ